MSYGKFEISEYSILLICLTIFMAVIMICSMQVDIAKEETKQLELQYSNNINEVEEN